MGSRMKIAQLEDTIKRLTKELEEALQRGVVLAIKSEKNEHRADSLAAELTQAKQERDDWQMQTMALLKLPVLQYLLTSVEAHAGKFPVPSHVLSMCAEIRTALSPKPEVVREVDRDEVDMEQLEHDA